MKYNMKNWTRKCESNKFFCEDIKSFAKNVNNYNLYSCEMDINFTHRCREIIDKLEKQDIFSYEECEGWKERYEAFFEFCKKIV